MQEDYTEKEASVSPEISEEIKREISSHAVMNAEVYLASLHAENPDEEIREPRENEVSAHVSAYNDFRLAHSQEQMTEGEIEIYDLAFRERFAKGYIENKVN